MPTIYVHIPFCRKACYYCDFHFSTNFTQKTAMINAINKEIVLQKDYFSEKNSISSIYFGGGTPSVLSQTELESVLKNIYNNFEVDPQAEITLEANPDDLNKNKLKELKSLGINRLSIGVQSFDEAFLKYMNRSHNAKQSLECLENAQKIGFDNLSFDLIYGVPAQNHDFWKKDLQMASQIGAKHISAYCLTIEEKTVFGKWLKNKKINEINDDFANDQFDMLVENLENKGYQHYEISNFAMPNHYSKHNTNYWKKGSYLGIGASAHSYNQQNRQFNISNNSLYIKQIEKGIIPCETEILTKADHINEYLMTSLRTMWGCDLDFLVNNFQFDLKTEKKEELEKYLQNNYLLLQENTIFLTKIGKLFANTIASDLFI